MRVIRKPACAAGRLPRRLRGDRSGIALTEFAFALPFLTIIVMAGVETANFAITVLRVNQLAMLAADNAARVRTSIDEQDMNEVMIGLRFAGQGIGFGQKGRVIISSLESNGYTDSRKGYKITWQRCFGARNVTSSYGVVGQGANNASLAAGMGPAGKKIEPVPGAALVFAEIRYTYSPAVASMFMDDMELTSLQSFTVRERASEALTNTTSMPDASKRLCDAAHLSAT